MLPSWVCKGMYGLETIAPCAAYRQPTTRAVITMLMVDMACPFPLSQVVSNAYPHINPSLPTSASVIP